MDFTHTLGADSLPVPQRKSISYPVYNRPFALWGTQYFVWLFTIGSVVWSP